MQTISFYIYLNRLYKSDKLLAINNIKQRPKNIPLLLKYLRHDFLEDLGIYTKDITKQIISYNTSHYFINYRSYDIKYNILNLLNERNLDKFDSLFLLDFNMSFNRNFFSIDLSPFVLELVKKREINLNFIKLVKYVSPNTFWDLIRQNYNLLKFLLVHDKSLLDDKKVLMSLLGTNLTDLVILSLPYKEWASIRPHISDGFIKKYFYKFNIVDLLVLKDAKFVWNILKNESYKVRYQMYSEMKVDNKILNFVRQDLKNLVKSNYKMISKKYKSNLVDTISIIKEIVDQIVIFPPLIELSYSVISELEDIAKDICMFYILKFISEKSSFITGSSFSRWYFNLVRFIKLFYQEVDSSGLQDLIDLYIENKKYSCVLLFEITKTSSKLKDINEIFLYEDYDIKLKDDVYERYQVILKPEVKKCNIKYLTSYEVSKMDLECTDFEYEEEYLYVRNVARLISQNIKKVEDFEKIKKFFMKCCSSQEEDIRLIGNSMISKIEIFNKK
ncbi:putative heat repeat protein [Vairimorpha necatrix]|uniref:Heat repeat protein n=1 Tax=Vairimorpha necatrix TaxID=6039 RepID=A0AAX4JA41_9MICR